MRKDVLSRGLALVLAGLVAIATACSDSSSSAPPSAPCTGASCGSACAPPETSCGGRCVDTQADAQNCGACGKACPAGTLCAGGQCGCPRERSICQTQGGPSCIDLNTSPSNCGACGRACTADESCVGAVCVCSTSAIVCGGACTDPRTNPKHCGATAGCGEGGVGIAGDACSANRYCSEGACVPCAAFAPARTAASSGRVSATFATTLALGDLNKDGKIDLVSAGSSIEVFLGHGDGGFEPVQRIARGGYFSTTSTIALADMDADGRLDLVGVGFIAFGYGDGTLDPNVLALPAANRPGPSIADFDGDGRPDIVYPWDVVYNGFSLLRNAGARTFDPPKKFTTNSQQPLVAATTGDFNGDGKPDVAFADDPKMLYLDDPAGVDVLLGNGDLTFGPVKRYVAGKSGSAVTNADVDGDGHLDLVTANDSSVSVFLGKGDGSFADAKNLVVFPRTRSVVAADVSGDGVIDIVTSSNEAVPYWNPQPHFEVRIGAGDGTFFPAQVYPGGGGSVAVADVNGDGRADILVAEPSTNAVLIYLGTKQAACP